MLYLLAAILLLACAGYIALGVEDSRFHKNLSGGAARMSVPVAVAFWEDSLPGRPTLPWSVSESEGK